MVSNIGKSVFSENIVPLLLQKLLLDDLYQMKHCHTLLVPKADEDVRWVQDRAPLPTTRRRRTTTVDSGL